MSTVFAPGQTWADVIGEGNITAVSAVYDVSNLQDRRGRQRDRRRRDLVPEPSTWAMLLLGLFAISSMARRRALSRRR